MGACEKCWADAFEKSRMLGGSQADWYHRLLIERADNPCTPDDQRTPRQAPDFATRRLPSPEEE